VIHPVTSVRRLRYKLLQNNMQSVSSLNDNREITRINVSTRSQRATNMARAAPSSLRNYEQQQ